MSRACQEDCRGPYIYYIYIYSDKNTMESIQPYSNKLGLCTIILKVTQSTARRCRGRARDGGLRGRRALIQPQSTSRNTKGFISSGRGARNARNHVPTRRSSGEAKNGGRPPQRRFASRNKSISASRGTDRALHTLDGAPVRHDGIPAKSKAR